MSPPASKPAETSGSIGKTGSIRFNPKSPEFKPTAPSTLANEPASVRLNPSAPEFNPLRSGGQNGDTGIPGKFNLLPLDLSSPASTNGIDSHDNIMQLSILKLGRPLQTSSELNPKSSEFVPKLPPPPLNVKAPEFVPTNLAPSLPNGDLETKVGSNNGFGFVANMEEVPSLKPKDILHGFVSVVNQRDDVESESVLKVTAVVLIKATLYPASFDRQKVRLENTIKAWKPSEDTLLNLAEMLIYWVSELGRVGGKEGRRGGGGEKGDVV